MLHNYHEESSLRSTDISIQPHLSQEPMVNGGTGNSTACWLIIKKGYGCIWTWDAIQHYRHKLK